METADPATHPSLPLLYVVPPTVQLHKACIDDTRKSTLGIIRNWLESADPHTSRVLWLADISGSGKSAVARHVAWETTQNRQLLCSFFFRRDIEAQATTSRVISSLARELARLGGGIATDIANAAKGLQGAGYAECFHAQITVPLCKYPPSAPCLILMDALDESGSPETRAEFLSAMIHEIPLLPPAVKVMLTSKPQQDIDDALNRLGAGDESEDTDVYRLTFDVYGQENRKDLHTYVAHMFERVARVKRANGISLPPVWPSLPQKKSLVAHANGLFLWVATAADYVACSVDPQCALEELLALQNRPSPEAAIDALYKHLLHMAEATPGFNLPTYRDAVELVLAAPNPITVQEINQTLRRDAGPTLAALLPVMSNTPFVRIAHQSFREYVMDSQKCESRFFISKGTPRMGDQPPPSFSPQQRHDSFSSILYPRFPLPSLATVATYPHAQHLAPDVSDLIEPTSISSHPAARGAFGDVWRAKFRDGREIAIKSLRVYGNIAALGRHKLEKNSVRELVVWSRLDHPNVLSLLGICVFGGEIGMVAEWMPNGHVTEYSILHPEVDKLRLICDIAAGLSYLHNNGIVHGDLKGGNAVVAADGTCRLMDFGLAKLTEESLGVSTTSTLSGTTRWMPHELINPAEGAAAIITPSTDIYALGMRCQEILTGHPPFIELKNDLQVMYAVIKGDLPMRPSTEDAPQLTDRLWDLMNWCWARDPSVRPGATIVLEMLRLLRQ
ncbi:Tyrosine kinase family catalytic domain protein [Ceratobasidium sp. AG-Ba]|nr:Tyrosine kinase family catalytic domain protein [Ceratobasidium sp. AG-Ba]